MNNECSFYILLTLLQYPHFTLLPPAFLSSAVSVHACYLKLHQGKGTKNLQWYRTNADSSHSWACDWVYCYKTTLHRARQWYRGLSYYIQMFLPVYLLQLGFLFTPKQINTIDESIMSRTRADPTKTRQHTVWKLSQLQNCSSYPARSCIQIRFFFCAVNILRAF